MRRLTMLVMPILLALVEPLYAVFRKAMQLTSATMPALPRLLKNAQHAFQKRGYGKVLAGGRGFALRASVMAAVVMLLVLTSYVGAGALMLAFPVAVTTRDLPTILGELKKIQDDYRGKRMPEDVGTKFSELAKEAKELQDEADRDRLVADLEAKGKEIPNPTGLPSSGNQVEEKQNRPHDIAGYVTLGDFVLASPEFKHLADRHFAKGQNASVSVKGSLSGRYMIAGPGGAPLVALSREERKAFEAALESKAVPTLGTGVIEPTRLDRFPQVTADDRLTIRDVMSTGQTGQTGSVQYLREESHTQTAAETAHGVEKPEEAVEYSVQSATVATIAAWMPVLTQQLEDFAQLRGLLEGRLRYSVRRREEHQILWGNGAGANIEGIFEVDGTTDIENNGRAAGGDTLIDSLRRGITDVFVAGYNPNAAIVHPYDWETIVLEKGTDDRYVWAVVTDQNGSRLWGLRVVESVATQKRAGYANEERRALVADMQMGAQLLDRMDLTVLIGTIDRQLVENARTILVEERIALPIYAPAAFAWIRTQEQGT